MGRFHERMTVLSERCLMYALGSFPLKCPVPASQKAFLDTPWNEGRYWHDARWSDDPTRQSDGSGLFKFGRNVAIDGCVNYIGPWNTNPGLLCNGHYGTMQFFHSMASLEPGQTVAEAPDPSFETTADKIIGWTAFAFGVATGAPGPEKPFCEAARAYPAAGPALAPATFPECGKWAVRQFFGFRCSKPFTSKGCNVAVADADIPRVATGALLHMIQDSYSRSHTGRGEPRLPAKGDGSFEKPQVRCRAVNVFYRYTLAQKKVHGAYDQAPEFLPECNVRDAMDPITAGARMIWLVENRCDASWAKDLIREGVIGNHPTRIPADAAACRVAIA